VAYTCSPLNNMSNNLNAYLHQLKKLNRANPQLGKAPHKPILLISVLQLIRYDAIENSRIFISAELLIAFKSNWELLVGNWTYSNFRAAVFSPPERTFLAD
jgi:putative restriction endonuclease